MKKNDFIHTALQTAADKLHLLLRKVVFPHEYWDSEERFYENQLPPKSAFYSKLTGENINDDDFYLKTDVLLLCDVLEILENVV